MKIGKNAASALFVLTILCGREILIFLQIPDINTLTRITEENTVDNLSKSMRNSGTISMKEQHIYNLKCTPKI